MEIDSRVARHGRVFGQDVSNVAHHRASHKVKVHQNSKQARNRAVGVPVVVKAHRYNLRSRTKAQHRIGHAANPLAGKENLRPVAPVYVKVPMSVDTEDEIKPRKRRGRKRTAADMELDDEDEPPHKRQAMVVLPAVAELVEPDACAVSKWDADQVNDELAVPIYVCDIVAHMRQAERAKPVPPPRDSMQWQHDVNLRMRTILLDWLVEVHRKFQLLPQTLFLTVNLLDRYLSKQQVSRNRLQLMGCACMWIACKYHEIYAPEINDFVYISDNAFAPKDLIASESGIVGALHFEFTVPTSFAFAERFVKVGVAVVDARRAVRRRDERLKQQQRRARRGAKPSSALLAGDQETEEERKRREYEVSVVRNLTHYTMEHCFMDPVLAAQAPSRVAAACLAFSLLGTRLAEWTPDLAEETAYTLSELLSVMARLDDILKNPKCKHKAVRKKYAHSKHAKVSQINFTTFDVRKLARDARIGSMMEF